MLRRRLTTIGITALAGLPFGEAPAIPPLLYRATVEGRPEVWSIGAEGVPRRFLAQGLAAFDIAVSSEGLVAFMRPDRTGRQQLWLADGPTRAPRRLTNSGADDRLPAFGPGGRWVAFSRAEIRGSMTIWLINARGGEELRLSGPPAAGRLDLSPAWSPDGSLIAFASNRDGAFRIWMMSADGSHVRPVTAPGAADLDPAWAPDGRRLAFTRQFPDGSVDLVIRDLISGTERRLALPGSEGRPAWSPDGGRLAFASDADGDLEIYQINADGTGLEQLTRNDSDDTTPVWPRRLPAR